MPARQTADPDLIKAAAKGLYLKANLGELLETVALGVRDGDIAGVKLLLSEMEKLGVPSTLVSVLGDAADDLYKQLHPMEPAGLQQNRIQLN